MREELAALVAAIKGIHYELADIWDIVERVRAEDVFWTVSRRNLLNSSRDRHLGEDCLGWRLAPLVRDCAHRGEGISPSPA